MTLPAQDIVERLREADANSQQRTLGSRIFGEAADTISRLTADNEALRKELGEARAAHHRTSHKAVKRLRALWREKQTAEARADALAQEVERLRSEIETYRTAFDGIGPSSRITDLEAEVGRLQDQILSARAFVERHPALTLIDLAEFEAFLKVAAAIDAALANEEAGR